MTKLKQRYTEALQLVKKVNGELAASGSAAENGGLGTTHIDSAMISHAKNRMPYYSSWAAAAQTKYSTKEKRTAALLNRHDF